MTPRSPPPPPRDLRRKVGEALGWEYFDLRFSGAVLNDLSALLAELGVGREARIQAERPQLQRVPIAAGCRHWLRVRDNGGIETGGRALRAGEAVPPQRVVPDLRGRRAVAVAASVDHSLALLNDGDVAAWGDNTDGQTAIPDRGGRRAVGIAAGSRFSIVLLEDGRLLRCGLLTNYNRPSPPWPDFGGRRVVRIAAGGGLHALFMLDDGDVVACGDNAWGQCDLPDRGGRKAEDITCGDYHSVIALEDGSVVGCGRKFDPFDILDGLDGLSFPDRGGRRITAVSCGYDHTLLHCADGGVLACGAGNALHPGFPDTERSIVAVAAGDGFSVFLKSNGEVVISGRGLQ